MILHHVTLSFFKLFFKELSKPTNLYHIFYDLTYGLWLMHPANFIIGRTLDAIGHPLDAIICDALIIHNTFAQLMAKRVPICDAKISFFYIKQL